MKRRLKYKLFKKIYNIFLVPSILILFYINLYTLKEVYENLADSYHKRSPNQITEFEDKYFQRILDTFKNKTLNKYSKRNFKGGETPTILFILKQKLSTAYWEEQLHHITSGQCPFQCKLTRKYRDYEIADAVLFYLKHIRSRDNLLSILPHRDAAQPWIILNFEAPFLANAIFKINYHDLDGIFNRTMTYRQDSDIIVTHGFITSKEDSRLLPLDWRIENYRNLSESLEPSNASITALISNCEDNSGRLDYIDELQSHIEVDVYGECGTLNCGHSMYAGQGYKPYEDKCLKRLGKRYKYYLAIENSICTDYGTEKIYNMLFYPLVPIVMGGINYEDILPPHSYINAALFTPAELAKHIRFLNDNPAEYEKYHDWRKYYVPSTIGATRMLCDLCARLHDPSFYEYNVITDFYKWFVGGSKCWKWTTKGNPTL